MSQSWSIAAGRTGVNFRSRASLVGGVFQEGHCDRPLTLENCQESYAEVGVEIAAGALFYQGGPAGLQDLSTLGRDLVFRTAAGAGFSGSNKTGLGKGGHLGRVYGSGALSRPDPEFAENLVPNFLRSRSAYK